MNCYYHPDRPAVAQCKNCGKGFCKEDAELLIDGVCPECRAMMEQRAREQVETQRKEKSIVKKAWYQATLKNSLIGGIVFSAVLLLAFLMHPSVIKELGLWGLLYMPVAIFIGGGWMVMCWIYSGKWLHAAIEKSMPQGFGCFMSIPLYIILRGIISLLLVGSTFTPLILTVYTIIRARRAQTQS